MTACNHPQCDAAKGKDSLQWGRCYTCTVGGWYCPAHLKPHYETHVERPVVCWIVTPTGAET